MEFTVGLSDHCSQKKLSFFPDKNNNNYFLSILNPDSPKLLVYASDCLSHGAARHLSASVTVMENPSWQIWATPVSRTALPRDSQRRSPEISSNPNLCNPSPGPGIVSWTTSPSKPHSVRPPLQWNNTAEEAVNVWATVTGRRDLTRISFSCMRGHFRHIERWQTVTRRPQTGLQMQHVVQQLL